jgi:biopolymer transport protein ExbD
MEFSKKHRRHPPEPQLAALIDVLSILILFLVAGTVFGQSSVELFQDIILPISQSKENVNAGPQVSVSKASVTDAFLKRPVPIESYINEDQNLQQELNSAVKAYMEAPVALEGGNLLNVVADKNLSYRNVFKVIKMYRQAGIKSVLFISESR